MDFWGAFPSVLFFLLSLFLLLKWTGALQRRAATMTARLVVLPLGMSYSAICIIKKIGVDGKKNFADIVLYAFVPFLFACLLYLFLYAWMPEREMETPEALDDESLPRPMHFFVLFLLSLFLYGILDLQTWSPNIEAGLLLFRVIPFFVIVVIGFFASIPFSIPEGEDPKGRRIHTLFAWRRNSLVLTGVLVCGNSILFLQDSLGFEMSVFLTLLYGCVVYIFCTGSLIEQNGIREPQRQNGLIGLLLLFVFCSFWILGIIFIDVQVFERAQLQ